MFPRRVFNREDSAADAVSLHSFVGDGADQSDDEQGMRSRNTATLDLDLYLDVDDGDEGDRGDEPAPDGYFVLACQLFSTGSYAVTSKGPLPPGFDRGDYAKAHHDLYQDRDSPSHSWQPWLSGRPTRFALPITIWLVVLFHLAVSHTSVTKVSAVHNHGLRLSIPGKSEYFEIADDDEEEDGMVMVSPD
ncbi:hypothetical protein BU16DRAFT_554296 [Lophium mytilinum]|uniref:Uncharacterized protein n=1 Tax=Lophium mytilinum TaxID=390894 RepID=A0A6A6RCP4_9PEZI|nr:hypothetical protein BU16DRAFT_554296 [Lophium mytilinum]